MAPGTSGHLHDQLCHALGGAKIGAEQAMVRIEDADQRDIGEMVALGEHLGTEQQPGMATACSLQQRIERTLAPRGITVDTQYLYIREMPGQCLFNPFRALALRVQVAALTFRAVAVERALAATVVTMQAVVAPVPGEVRITLPSTTNAKL